MQSPVSLAALMNHEVFPCLQWIEVASRFQIPGFQIVGLPSQEIQESKERVRAAVEAIGFEFPRRKITLNLSPASVKKQGTGVDLAMALAILAHHQEFQPDPSLKKGLAWGELSLQGKVRPVGQCIRALIAAWEGQADFLILAQEDALIAQKWVQYLQKNSLYCQAPPKIFGVSNLMEAWNSLNGTFQASLLPSKEKNLSPFESDLEEPAEHSLLPLSFPLERALGLSASGQHHLLLLGPRGVGKTHALEWIAALQPQGLPATFLIHRLFEELHSSKPAPRAGKHSRPVRKVGTHTRPAALIGSVNSNLLQPGEFSLAHGGLLIADEWPEWNRDTRESFREPLEQGKVTLTRTRGQFEFPARFVLAATGNFCPCGGWPADLPLPAQTDQKPLKCKCPPHQKELYQNRLSGPLLDRIDIVTRILRPPLKRAFSPTEIKTHFDSLKEKVEMTHLRLVKAYGQAPGNLKGADLESLLHSHPKWQKLLERETPSLSLRGRHQVLKVALTLKAWDVKDDLEPVHLQEASRYRPENAGWT